MLTMKMIKCTKLLKYKRPAGEMAAKTKSINFITGRNRSHGERIKHLISYVLDKNIPLGSRIAALFRREVVTIVSVLTAFGMAVIQ